MCEEVQSCRVSTGVLFVTSRGHEATGRRVGPRIRDDKDSKGLGPAAPATWRPPFQQCSLLPQRVCPQPARAHIKHANVPGSGKVDYHEFALRSSPEQDGLHVLERLWFQDGPTPQSQNGGDSPRHAKGCWEGTGKQSTSVGGAGARRCSRTSRGRRAGCLHGEAGRREQREVRKEGANHQELFLTAPVQQPLTKTWHAKKVSSSAGFLPALPFQRGPPPWCFVFFHVDDADGVCRWSGGSPIG